MEEDIPVPRPGILDRFPAAKILAAFALLAVVASAAVVAYLSSAATVNADVKSPSKTFFTDVSTGTISEDGLTWNMGEITGGSSYKSQFRLESVANNPFNAQVQLNCKDDKGPTCDVKVSHSEYGDLGCDGGKFIVEKDVALEPGSTKDVGLVITPSLTYLGTLGCELQAFPVAS